MTLVQPPLAFRADWNALPPKSNPGGFSSYDATVCHYTAANKGYAVPESGDHSRCVSQVQSIQRQHQAIANQSDIEYNALACNHGVLFEGRVKGYKGGANGTASSNATMPSICCLLGVGDQPSDKMLNAVAWFHSRVESIAGRLLEMKKHKDIYATSCPGDPMSALIDQRFYRTLIDDGSPVPQPPTPIPPGDDMPTRPDVVQISSEWDGLPVGAVCICSIDFQTYRHVTDEDELNQLRMSYDRLGFAPIDPIPAIPGWWLKQYGKRL